MIVLGAGAVGVEFASIYATLRLQGDRSSSCSRA